MQEISENCGIVEDLKRRVEGMAANKGLFSTPRMKALLAMRNKHEGETGILLGNGPSVRYEDLERIHEAGLPVFACNRFYMAYEKTPLRPLYTLGSDRKTLTDFGQEMVDKAGGTKFVILSKDPGFSGDYIWVKRLRASFGFSGNALQGVYAMGGTLIAAGQIAHFMGFKRLFLYGVDHSFVWEEVEDESDLYKSAKGGDNHFIPGYRGGAAWCPPQYRMIEVGFHVIMAMFEKRGGGLWNASRQTELPVIERVGFEDLMSSVNGES